MEHVRNTIRRRHLSRRTEEAYAGWIRRFILFHGKRHPREMAEGEVAAFLTSLARGGSVSPSTQNQALAALLFLYKVVLESPLGWVEGVVHAKRPERLPVVLTRDEVRDLLGKLKGTPWLVATLLYGSGLRVLEALTLRIKDLDLEKQQFHIRDGKGRRDRRTMIPRAVMGPLRNRSPPSSPSTKRIAPAAADTSRFQTPSPASIPTPVPNCAGSGCSPPPGPIGIHPPARPAATTCTKPSSSGLSRSPPSKPASPSSPAPTPSATASPPTSSRTATTSAPSRTC
jgi:hypothetical protein